MADGFGDRVIPMDDDDFPDDDLSETPEFPLPEGVSKEILTEAKTSEWKKPKMGDEVARLMPYHLLGCCYALDGHPNSNFSI